VGDVKNASKQSIFYLVAGPGSNATQLSATSWINTKQVLTILLPLPEVSAAFLGFPFEAAVAASASA
jgi:hypothetical protein